MTSIVLPPLFLVHAEHGKLRQRRFHEKTRTGCTTCRRRHLKCDERQPMCDRCRKSGLSCSGPQANQHINALQFTTLTKEQLRSLQFFREQTSSVLVGHFNNDFWSAAILRLSYSNTHLQNFLIAIGSLDESFRLRAVQGGLIMDPRPSYKFALQQYSIALTGTLRQTQQQKNLATLLASSMACILFELWLGDMANARVHAEAAQRLIATRDANSEHTYTEDETNELITHYLRPMVLRDCIQLAVSPAVDRYPNLPEVDIIRRLDEEEDFDQDFVTYFDARTGFETLSKLLLLAARWLIDNPEFPNIKDHWLKIRVRLIAWHIKLESVDKHLMQGRWNRNRERCLLEIRYRVFLINIMSRSATDEMFYDDYLRDFVAIVDAAAEFLVLSGAKVSASVAQRTHDIQTNMGLALVGFKCRDPYVRRRALRLLYRYRRLEGIWSSIILGITAEQIMLLEEDGLEELVASSSISARKRIRMKSLSYNPDKFDERWIGSNQNYSQYTPYMELIYERSSINESLSNAVRIPFMGYRLLPGFGNRSTAWFPNMPNADVFNSEIPDSHKRSDGPNMGTTAWTVVENPNLESVCNMHLLTMHLRSVTAV